MAAPRFCAYCGAPLVPGETSCSQCGSPIVRASFPGATPLPAGVVVGGTPTGGPPALSHDQERTATGLFALAIAFGLSWIPYVNILAGIIALIGLVYLWLGRRAFGEAHRRYVFGGCLLIVLGFLAGVAVVLVLAGAIVAAASQPGATPTDVGNALRNALIVAYTAGVVAGAMSALGHTLLPYALVGRSRRQLLWAAFVATVVVSAAVPAILLPQVNAAITQATSGTTIDLGPIQALQTESTLLGLLILLPNLLYLWVYYQARQDVLAGKGPVDTKSFLG